MRNYSSKRAKKGKLAYRTPDRFIYKQVLKAVRNKCQMNPVGEFRKKISSEFSTISPKARSSEIPLRGKEKIRSHIFVSGRVQGVFFRSETCNKAREFGLTGWVKNLEDPYVAFGDRDGGRRPSHGRVEAVFEGDKDKVEKIIEWAKKGPILAKVKKVEIIFEEYKGEFKSFEKID